MINLPPAYIGPGDTADLHVHTMFSDGTFTPEELVDLAVELGLGAIAITDHDAIGAIARARRAAEGLELTVVSGVELSATDGETDIHILGYGFDLDNAGLCARLEEFRRARYRRAEEMVRRLQHVGVKIEMEEVAEVAGEGAIGRPHVATLLHRKGYVASFTGAFHHYIGPDDPAYVAKEMVTPAEAIALLRAAGALPVMAHPAITRRDELIPAMVEAGLQGMEVVHPSHKASEVEHYSRLARKHNLVATGGSDSHGLRDRPSVSMGKFMVPLGVVQEIEDRRDRVGQA